MKNKWILITAIILFAVVFAFAGWKLMEQQREYQAGEEIGQRHPLIDFTLTDDEPSIIYERGGADK